MAEAKFGIIVLADYAGKILFRERFAKSYMDSRRRYGDAVLWPGYHETYDPDRKTDADFRYDGKAVRFCAEDYGKVFQEFRPKCDIRPLYITVIGRNDDGMAFRTTGETFDKFISMINGDFCRDLDDLVERRKTGWDPFAAPVRDGDDTASGTSSTDWTAFLDILNLLIIFQ